MGRSMQLNLKWYCLNVLCLILMSQRSFALDLTNVEVLGRCYGQITQTQVPPNSQLVKDVQNNVKDPITACLEILDSAKLTQANSTTIDVTKPKAKDVLRTMHHLHSTWFENRVFIAINELDRAESTRAALDITAPAAYLTRALFGNGVPYDDILKNKTNLSPVRTIMAPTVTQVPPITYKTFPPNFAIAPIGDIIGVYDRVGITYGPFVGSDGVTYGQKANISYVMGAGILGSQAYLMSTVNGDSGFRSDGSTQMPRKWAKSVYHDLLCRELPTVREVDGASFVSATATATFRRSSACVYCHASIDRMSGVVRNLRYHNALGAENQSIGNFVSDVFIVDKATPVASTGTWLTTANQQFSRSTPATGVLYYRNYLGNLIDSPVADLTDLGLQISQQDDFYICAAKRYYKYFIGVDAFVGDMGDLNRPVNLSAAELKHRNKVIELGLALKNDPKRSIRKLVESILRLPTYRKSDYNRGSP